ARRSSPAASCSASRTIRTIPSRRAAFAALFCAALPIATQGVVIGPLLPRIERDLDISHTVAGLLGTLFILCLAICAPLGARVAGRFGVYSGLTACLAGLACFGVARALAPSAPA